MAALEIVTGSHEGWKPVKVPVDIDGGLTFTPDARAALAAYRQTQRFLFPGAMVFGIRVEGATVPFEVYGLEDPIDDLPFE